MGYSKQATVICGLTKNELASFVLSKALKWLRNTSVMLTNCKNFAVHLILFSTYEIICSLNIPSFDSYGLHILNASFWHGIPFNVISS